MTDAEKEQVRWMARTQAGGHPSWEERAENEIATIEASEAKLAAEAKAKADQEAAAEKLKAEQEAEAKAKLAAEHKKPVHHKKA